MATTIYKFQADLTGLISLNKGLREAKMNLDRLKTGTVQYAAAAKTMGGMTATMNRNTAAIRRTTTATATLNTHGSRMIAIFKSASIAIVAAFAFRAIIGGITGVIKVFAKFESQMAAVKAISGASEEQFVQLTKSAIELGRTTVFTAIQVAKLQEEFARLGFTTKEILAAQSATLALAAATGEDLSSAAAIAGSSLRAFEMDATQIVRVTNVMGEAFTGSALNLERFTQSMKFAAPIARTAGFTIEETSSMLMVLADAGLHGSIAGNALKNIFLRLGDANSSLNKHIGHTVQGLPQLIEEMKKMKKATFGLTEATALLDKRSAPAFLVLLRNIKEIELNLDTLNKAEGSISRMASIRLDTLSGDFALMNSAMEGLGLAVGDAFDFKMRKAIQNLTDFITRLTESGGAIRKIRRVFNALGMAIKVLIVRFALIKIGTLGMALSFKGAIQPLRVMAMSMYNLATGTGAASLAFKGLRTAMVSTGFGAIIVGLGMLVGYMWDLTDSGDEAAHSMERLNRTFQQELSSVTLINEASSERHDKIREIVATYDKLLFNIDLEILNNKEMVKLQAILNDARVKGNKINAEAAAARMVALEEEMEAEKTKSALEVTRMEKEKTTESYNIGGSAQRDQQWMTYTTADLVRVEEQNLAALLKTKQSALNIATANNKKYNDEAKKAFDDLVALSDLELEQHSIFRIDLRTEWLKKLEAFRKMNHGMQESEKKKYTQQQKDMEKGQQLAMLEVDIVKFRENNKTALLASSLALQTQLRADSSKAALKYELDFSDATKNMTIRLSEFKRFVTSLSTVLVKSGRSYKKSALAGFRLNNTKDRLKELLDLQVKQIKDSFAHDIAAEEASFKFKTQKYNKEKQLIATNIKSLASIKKNSSKKQIIADLKANRTKYAALKNIDQKEWDRLMKGRKVNMSEYHAFIDKMNAEEVAKQVTNNQVIKEVKKVHDLEIDMITMHQQHKVANFQLEIRGEKLRNMDEDLSFLKKNQALRMNEFTIAQDEEKRQDEELVAAGEMHAIDAMAREKAREQDLTDFKRAQNQERLAAISETYSQMAQMIMAVSANIAAANIAQIEGDFEVQQSTEQDKFDRKLEIAEAAGQDTAAMQKTQDDKMEVLENRKNERIRAIKKRQFMIDKVNNIAMALINGAQAIAKVTAETGVAAIVAAPLTAALIAAQIATIMAQKFVGAKGGIIPGGDGKMAKGGMVVGGSHAQGGVKFAVGGRVAELEGGEAVINKRSTAMYRPQLSAMNAAGGGVKFERGGITPGTRNALSNAKGTWNANDIAGLISSSINAQQVYVTEADITTTQSTVSITEGLSTVFK